MTERNNYRVDLLKRRLASGNRIAFSSSQLAEVVDRFTSSALPSLRRGREMLSYRRTLGPITSKIEAPSSPSSGDPAREYTFTISSNAIDRAGDTVNASGWRLDNYRRNPVVLWAHDGKLMPVGRSTKVWIEGNKLKATMRLASVSANIDAERVGHMIDEGFLSGASVGFIPLRYEFSTAPDRKFGIDFLETELLEWSLCPVPANPECLIHRGVGSGKSQSRSPIDSAKAALRRRRELDLERILRSARR